MAARHLHIPGLEEAIAAERELRNEAYLNAPRNICGVLVNQITPQIHARLCAIKTPFLGSGDATGKDALAFLWICSRDFRNQSDFGYFAAWRANLAMRRFFKTHALIDPDQAVEEIDLFIEHTYMDCPKSGKRSKPYYSMNASVECAMSSEPFGWDYDTRTQFVPFRRIFQLMNVRRHQSGGVVDNPISDKVTQDYLRQLNDDPDMRAFFELARLSQIPPNQEAHGDN